ncbi:MAG: thioesterase family protein [Verrucomicrobiota bacterium]
MPGQSPSIQTEEEVMFFDTDAGAVVHNLAYLRFIETARTKLGTQLGLNLTEMAAQNQYAVLLRTEVDYKKPARLGDTLHIRGHLDSIEKIRFWCAFEVHRPVDETLLVTCRQQLALVQLPEGKPLRLPKDWQSYSTPSIS